MKHIYKLHNLEIITEQNTETKQRRYRIDITFESPTGPLYTAAAKHDNGNIAYFQTKNAAKKHLQTLKIENSWQDIKEDTP